MTAHWSVQEPIVVPSFVCCTIIIEKQFFSIRKQTKFLTYLLRVHISNLFIAGKSRRRYQGWPWGEPHSIMKKTSKNLQKRWMPDKYVFLRLVLRFTFYVLKYVLRLMIRRDPHLDHLWYISNQNQFLRSQLGIRILRRFSLFRKKLISAKYS